MTLPPLTMAVKYYLTHKDGYDNTCKSFDCKYKTSKNFTRKIENPIS